MSRNAQNFITSDECDRDTASTNAISEDKTLLIAEKAKSIEDASIAKYAV